MALPRRPRREDYTVGWVCALPIELAAAKEMLDEEYQDSDIDDSKIYTLGRIGEHNVIVVCLPEGQTGTNLAAAVAAQINAAFTSIRFGLMVGIGSTSPCLLSLNVQLANIAGQAVLGSSTEASAGKVRYA